MAKKVTERESVSWTSANLTEERLKYLKDLLPEAFSEGRVDFEKLRQALGDLVDDRPERYSFTWAGKRDAIRLLQTPSRATLLPAPEESVNFETTQNLFIEGDNLEVLKLLYKPYAGRVKMIYIDPPYNTGNEFVYPDNFTVPLDAYLELTSQTDGNGNFLTSNPETSGRYHSAWLSMMYPRLFVARQLLREDGVIFISIDDHEAHNLRIMMNEIFGEENFIAQLVWEKGRKNDAKLFSVGHEYMIIYARSRATLRDLGTVWRESKPGAREIWDKYCQLRGKHADNDEITEEELQKWYKELPKDHPSKKLSRYKHIDKFGPWRDRDISWPGGGGPRYDVIHPATKKPCKVPEAGWRFASSEAMEKQIRLGLVVFREDHTQPPFRKAHLCPVPDELDEDEDAEFSENGNGNDEASLSIGMQVMGSVIYKQSQVAVKYLRSLMDEKIFNNPKDHEVLAQIINYCTKPNENEIVLDFFAGASSAAESVLKLNHEENNNLRFIMVQLPEPINTSTSTGKNALSMGMKTIAEIGKERIRRAINKIKKDREGGLKDRKQHEDLGFKVFKLAESHYRQWSGVEEKDPEKYAETMKFFTDPLLSGWKLLNVIYEVALKEGYSLTSTVEELKEVTDNTVYRVTDPDKDQSFLICLDNELKIKTVKSLKLNKDAVFICRDSALTDELAANAALQCHLKTI